MNNLSLMLINFSPYLLYFLLPLLAASAVLFGWAAMRSLRQAKSDTVSEGIFIVPFTDENFIGRETELARLDELFKTQSTVALTGISGVGKTRLAVHYAYQQKQRYPFILWVSASTKAILDDSFASIADELKADPLLKQTEKIAFVKNWLEKKSNWLLVFDNADNTNEITNEVLQKLVPAVPLGKILFTTQITTKNFTENLLPIGCLDKQAGARFLWECIGADKQPTPTEISDAEAISTELAGLPLALKQAAAYIETNQYVLPEYLQFYQQYAKELLDPDLNFHQQSITDHLSVFATLNLSFSRLPTESQEILSFCAIFRADSIPEEILTTAFELDTFSLNKRLKPIFCYGLMARNSTDKTLSLHRLVQQVLLLNTDNEQKQVQVEQAITALNVLLPNVELKDWQQYDRLLFSGLACAQWIIDLPISNTVAGFLLNQMATYLQNAKADYSQAEPLYLNSLAIYEKTLGEEHPLVATSLNNLAELYRIQGKYTEAEPLYLRSLAIREKALGKDHPDVAISLNNLAVLYDSQGKPDKAEPLYQRSLTIWENTLGNDHPAVAQSLNNLAALYQNQNNYAKAEPLYLRSLEISEKTLGENHPAVAQSLNNLAALYQNQGNYAQAEPLYLRSLKIRKAILGKNHPSVASSLNNLASFYYVQGKYEKAEPLYQRSLEIWETTLGKDHPDVAQSLNNLAALYQNQGNCVKAKSLYLRSLAISEKTLGKDHPKTKLLRNNLETLSSV